MGPFWWLMQGSGIGLWLVMLWYFFGWVIELSLDDISGGAPGGDEELIRGREVRHTLFQVYQGEIVKREQEMSNRRKAQGGQTRTFGSVRTTGLGMHYQPRPGAESGEPSVVPGRHSWIVTAMHQLSDRSAAEAVLGGGGPTYMDSENLVGIQGPWCYVCEQPWSPQLAVTRCPGEPS